MNMDTILVREIEPASAIVDDNAVLLSVQAGAFFRLNRVGTEIWEMLIKPRRVGEIFDVLSQSYDVDGNTLTRDVTEFLEALVKRHLVRVVTVGDVE